MNIVIKIQQMMNKINNMQAKINCLHIIYFYDMLKKNINIHF